MTTVDDKLKQIVGENNIDASPKVVGKYFEGEVEAPGLVIVSPGSHEEVQEILRWAGRRARKVLTTYGNPLPARAAESQGAILDFSRMNQVERLDPRNLTAHIQRGVTFEQLEPLLAEAKVRLPIPFATTTKFVAESAAGRDPIKSGARNPEVQLSNMKLVLPDGDTINSGSHQLSENADLKEDPGPNISRWYFGSEESFAVMTRASVFLYPRREKRAIVAGFEDLDVLKGAMREIALRQQAQEILGLDVASLALRLGVEKTDHPWYLLCGTEQFPKLLTVFHKEMTDMVKNRGGVPMPDLEESALNALDKPWEVPFRHNTGCYAPFPKMSEIEKAVQAGGEVSRMFMAYGFGAALYCQFTAEDQAAKQQAIGEALLGAGGMIDRPQGETADNAYSQMPDTNLDMIRKVKNIYDAGGVLNPESLRV